MGKKGSWLSTLKRVFTPTPKDKPSAFNTTEPEQRQARDGKKKWPAGKTKHEADTSGRFFQLQRGPSSVEKILGDADREIQRVNLLPPKRPHHAYQHHQHSHHHHQQGRHHYNQPHQQQQQHNQHHGQKPQYPRHYSQPPHQQMPQHPPPQQQQMHQYPPPQQQQMPQHPPPYQQKPKQPPPQQQKPQQPPPHQQQLLLPPPLPLPRATVPIAVMSARTPMWPFAQRRFNAAATRIQAAYRGHMARQGYRALRGLVRLQVVMRGQGVRRQTVSALRTTQTLVRVQAQVRWMRLQMAENRNTVHHHNNSRFPRQQQQQQQLYLAAAPAGDRNGAESILSKWSASHVAAADRRQSGWDDSLLPREEIQARVQRKVEAITKRERALAYHYNHQLFKASPASAYSALAEAKNGGFPIWWGWVDKHQNRPQDGTFITPPPPATASYYMRPNPSAETTQKHQTPAPSRPSSRPATSKQRRSGGGQAIRDDESLTSCPPVPSYMAPTVSAKAKVREAPSPTPAPSKRRFTFGLTSSLWGGGGSSLFAGKGKDKPSARPQSVAGRRHRPARSIGEMSFDSTVSLPVGVGRSVFK